MSYSHSWNEGEKVSFSFLLFQGKKSGVNKDDFIPSISMWYVWVSCSFLTLLFGL